MEYDIIGIQESLKKLQSAPRFLHSLGVQYTSANLAMRYGYDLKKAEVTGLLHDCAKYMSGKMMLQECQRNNIEISDIEKESSFLLHGKLGAFYAEKEYSVLDDEILDAIRFHTTGKPNMSFIEKIVYVADYIEPSRRNIKNIDQLRRVAYEDLDRAVYLISECILQYLDKKSDKIVIDPLTKKTYDFYKELCK